MPSDKHLAQLKTFNGTERQLAAEGVLDGAKEEKKRPALMTSPTVKGQVEILIGENVLQNHRCRVSNVRPCENRAK